MGDTMTRRCWSGLAFGTLVIGIVPVVLAMAGGHTDQPWPNLLASEAYNVDQDIAMLRLRADMMLDRLKVPGR
jgi:hypothetical protein